MLRRMIVLAAALAVFAAPAAAQSTAPPTPKKATNAANQAPPVPPSPPAPVAPAAPPAPPPPPAPPRRGQPINIKIDVVITDQRGTAAPVKKTLSVIVGDQQTGLIRSDAWIANAVGTVPLHVDAEPELLPDGKIRLRFGLNYDLPSEGQTGSTTDHVMKFAIRENVALVLENGKALQVTQSADPVGDRQVMVEVKATVLK